MGRKGRRNEQQPVAKKRTSGTAKAPAEKPSEADQVPAGTEKPLGRSGKHVPQPHSSAAQPKRKPGPRSKSLNSIPLAEPEEEREGRRSTRSTSTSSPKSNHNEDDSDSAVAISDAASEPSWGRTSTFVLNKMEEPEPELKESHLTSPPPKKGGATANAPKKVADKEEEEPKDGGEWEVQKVLAKRNRGGRVHYLIKWTGFPENEATWEPEGNLAKCWELVAKFNNENKKRKGKNGKGKGKNKNGRGASSDDETYDIEEIRDKRIHKGKIQYLIKWDGYGSDENTWEPESHLRECMVYVDQFNKEQDEKKANEDEDEKKANEAQKRAGKKGNGVDDTPKKSKQEGN